MKNFNILGVHGKTRVLERGVHKKLIYKEDSLKGEAWTVCRFNGGLGKKEGGNF